MLRKDLGMALRMLRRNRLFTSLNVAGLAVGMACTLLILLFVRDELAFDRFHPNADRVYRLTQEWRLPEQPVKYSAITPPPLAPALRREFPEVLESARLLAYFEAALPGRVSVSHGENRFRDRFFWADGSFFRVFGWQPVAGDLEGALSAPNTAVVTASAARKYFGDGDPIGRVLTIDGGYSKEDYEVTAVVADVPANSHIEFDVLASFPTLEHVTDERVLLDEWWVSDAYTYVLLPAGFDAAELEAKLPDLVRKYFGEQGAPLVDFHLQPLTDIHLRSHLLNEYKPNSDVLYLYIFGAIAAITLLIAGINFVNLSTARATDRAREVGIRRAAGGLRRHLVRQFLTESVLLAALAAVLAVLLVWLALPAFNDFTGKAMSFGGAATDWLALAALALLVGLAAGSYPAFVLSSFQPVEVLKNAQFTSPGGALFRKVLVVFQLAVSIALISAAGVVYDQLRYMKNYDLGFDKEGVVIFPIRDVTLRHRYRAIQDELGKDPRILGTAMTSLVLGREAPQITTLFEGMERPQLIGSLVVDHDFAEVFGLRLVAGRGFSRDQPGDESSAFLLNEAAVRELGWASPQEAVGKRLNWGGWKRGEIVGVVEDFHYQPLRFHLQPLLLHIRPMAFHYLAARLAPGDPEDALDALRAKWSTLLPTTPFEYFFLDEDFDRLYRTEERLGALLGIFALVAIFVAALGLLGLAAFTAAQRTKEIGIRKALGSSASGVVMLLSGEFTRLVLVAVVLAWPLTFLAARDWLQHFPYRVAFGFGNLLLGALLALVVTWATVSFQSLKAALANPVKALRYE